MPKTKNAFALKNFDEERILQRKFFEEFLLNQHVTFHADTDANILELHNAGNISYRGTAEMEKRQADLFQIKLVIQKYVQRIKNHKKKISEQTIRSAARYVEQADKAVKILAHSKDLEERYSQVLKKIDSLSEKVLALYRQNEKAIQREYRDRFAQNLRNARLEKKMSQKEVAAVLGCAIPTYSNYERAELAPSFRNLARLSILLEVTIDKLIKS